MVPLCKNPSVGVRVLIGVAVALVMTIATTAVQEQGTSGAPKPSVSATAAPRPSTAANPATPGASVPASTPDAHTVIAYVTDVITWYGHLGAEAQLVSDPDETLFFANDRQTAAEIVRLAFEYARAQAAFLAKFGPNAAAAKSAAPVLRADGMGDVTQAVATLDTAADKLRAQVKDLQAQLAKAPAARRAALASEIQIAQNELDLNQARGDALKALVQFENGSASPDQSGTLAAQIDELEHSISDASKKTLAAPSESALSPPTPSSGIFGLGSGLIALSSKLDALQQSRALAQGLAGCAAVVRKSIVSAIASLDARGAALAQGAGASDVATLKQRKQAFESLLDEHKMLSAAALPLSKQIVLLGIYSNNLGKWQSAIEQRRRAEFHGLIIRLIGLGASLLLIFVASLAWRWLTDRYVTDIRRRGQVMAARRFVLVVLVIAVLLINFSDEIGSAATVLGFAAAGVAVALQNVILSIAGYFFLIGRFGIKVGDRVQIGGVTGDVIDIGLVKLSLMELGGTGTHREPTGRVVVFSNAIVFQPSGNFFKQAPGTSFVWNEVRLTLAPDVDYRLAEKRLLDAVDEVFARYRDRVMRDYRHLERDLNVMLETPKPQSRLQLSQAGLEIVIRYPAETYSAPQITDEISRRLLDAINREPSLRLVPQGTANIQTQTTPVAADNIDQTADVNGQPAEESPSAPAQEKSAGAARANK